MTKRAAIAKATGSFRVDDSTEDPLLRSHTVTALAQHVAECIVSCSSKKARAKPSRSACAQLALQILVIAAGIRRAALVDALSLTLDHASAIGTKLASLSAQPGSEDLHQVRLVFHAPTSQTFVTSTRQSLWTDVADLTTAVTPTHRLDTTLWVDARLTPEHSSPSLSPPDPHICDLVLAILQGICEDDTRDVLVVSQAGADQRSALSDDPDDAQLIGVALAGFLLEYGAIYCIHNRLSQEEARQFRYNVRPLRSLEQTPAEVDFAASPTNCLGTQPLVLFQVLWSDASDTSVELLSFSVPQCLCTDQDTQNRRALLLETFQARVEGLGSTSIFAQRRIAANVSLVTLSQVAL